MRIRTREEMKVGMTIRAEESTVRMDCLLPPIFDREKNRRGREIRRERKMEKKVRERVSGRRERITSTTFSPPTVRPQEKEKKVFRNLRYRIRKIS